MYLHFQLTENLMDEADCTTEFKAGFKYRSGMRE